MIFLALKEETSNTVAKIRKQEEEDAERIAELEKWVNGKVRVFFYMFMPSK